jgi:DME family drug/metabolite transporter
MTTTQRRGRLAILAASALWGTTGTTQALAPPAAQPLGVAAVRIVVGGAVLFGLALVGERSRLSTVPARGALVAALSLVGAQLCFFPAVARAGVAAGTVVAIGSAPIAAGALAWMFEGTRPGRRWSAATALGIGGCALLAGGGGTHGVDPTGVALALAVGVGYAGYTLATKRLVARCEPGTATAAVFGVAAVCMVPVLAVSDLAWVARPAGALAVAHLGLVTVALAYTLFARGLVVVSGPAAVTLTLAEPLTAGLLGVVVLGERLSPPALAGVLSIAAALVLLTVERAPRGPQTPASSRHEGERAGAPEARCL